MYDWDSSKIWDCQNSRRSAWSRHGQLPKRLTDKVSNESEQVMRVEKQWSRGDDKCCCMSWRKSKQRDTIHEANGFISTTPYQPYQFQLLRDTNQRHLIIRRPERAMLLSVTLPVPEITRYVKHRAPLGEYCIYSREAQRLHGHAQGEVSSLLELIRCRASPNDLMLATDAPTNKHTFGRVATVGT